MKKKIYILITSHYLHGYHPSLSWAATVASLISFLPLLLLSSSLFFNVVSWVSFSMSQRMSWNSLMMELSPKALQLNFKTKSSQWPRRPLNGAHDLTLNYLSDPISLHIFPLLTVLQPQWPCLFFELLRLIPTSGPLFWEYTSLSYPMAHFCSFRPLFKY